MLPSFSKQVYKYLKIEESFQINILSTWVFLDTFLKHMK